MGRLLPSRVGDSVDRDGDPTVLYVDNKETESVVASLSSETGMAIFRSLNEEAMTASELAEELDLSIQNVGYHLENLKEANLVEVLDTCYSEKGREMDIFAATSEPTVVVLGTEGNEAALRRAFGNLATAAGIPAVILVVWDTVSDRVADLVGA